MADKLRQFFSRHRSMTWGGILLLVGIGGIVLYQRFQGGTLTPGDTNTIPINVDGPQSLIGNGEGQTDPYGLGVGLSPGQAQLQQIQTSPLATGEPLSPEEIELIFSRLRDLPIDPDDQTTFQLPLEVLPPPRPGNTIKEPFPPLETGPTPGAVEAGPLQVLRFAPEGEIPAAPFVSVTFNQPMVPVGTLSDLAAIDVPVQIEPSLPGTWRWLGTKTLTFEYDSELIDRLPKATEYRVTVPAGTKSMNGGALTETVTWTFKTPPPKVLTTYPDNSPQPLEPIFFVAFDQRINPEAVLKTIAVRADGRGIELRLASQIEIDKDERVSQLVKDTPEGRWLAFRATEPFPAETNISIDIGPETPSAEGPLTTTETQVFGFSTYAPLRIEEHRCSWYEDRCPPLTPFYIRFNNPLDMNVYSEDMLRVEPEIPGVSANVYGNSIEINGATQGQTTYTVTVSGKLQDIFGQQLGNDARLTFRVGKADPVLVNSHQNFLTLDPTVSKKVFSVYAINYDKLHLKVYAVQPGDWTEFRQYLRDWQQTDVPSRMPGRLLEDRDYALDLPADALSQVDINLSQYMNGNFGHFVVIVEPPAKVFESEDDKWRRFSQTIITWVQITQIGLDAYNDHSEMVAWATDLQDGSPLDGVRIQPNNASATVLSGNDGVVRFDIPTGATYLVASQGADQAILPQSTYYWSDGGWSASRPSDTLRWYVFDDRQMYRPGEEVHIKGWLRRLGGKQNGDVGLVGNKINSISYQITDPQGNELRNGRADVNALGGFDFAFTVPQATNLGTAQLYLSAEGDLSGLDGIQFYHPFQIQEFRRPEFEVNARNETTGPYFVDDHATVAVEAKYYAGGGLPNAEVTWQVTTSPGSYSPPNWPDFTFGNWQPWWFYDFAYPGPTGESQTETFTGKTDASGTHYLDLDFNQKGDPAKDPQPKSVVAQATVMDVNRQAWSSTTTLLVHPADLYIGLRSDRYFVGRGTPLKVDFIVTDLDGNAVANRPVEITAGRLEWKLKNGSWAEEVVDVQTCTLLSQLEPDTCSFETPLGGSYQITAIVTDELGRKNQSRFTRWVSGGERPPSRKVEQEKVTLIPDKESYQPGDTAQVLVQSPFTPAEGLLTVSRSGILYTTRFTIEDGSATLDIPIEEEHIPNLNIQVDLAGSAPRTDDQGEPLANVPPRPAYATAQLNLSIPPLERTLSLQAIPDQDKLEPGGETTLTVTVKDAKGFPVSDAELAVVVVDEAILALTNYQLSDPLSVFYADRPSYLASVYGRASIVLADPRLVQAEAARQTEMFDAVGAAMPQSTMTAAATEAPAAAEESVLNRSQNQQTPINVRIDFNPLATFAPRVRTGSNGEARVSIKLPDNLTRYRVMVVAVDEKGNQFGTGESNITARLPLMVRPSAPRFLNFGDKFELPVVLQNQTDLAMIVDVVARATNLELEDAGLRVTVPANDRVEIRFPAATIMAGTVRVQVAAISGSYADAATVELPVYTPATTEAFATYGVIDEGATAQSVLYPSDVFPQFGGLEVNTSSTALQALTDAVLYLVSYPFECSEQLASRILAVASLRDVLTAFKADGLPAPEEMESAVERDIERLQGLQNYDGGFPYWRRGFESIPFNTIHVTHALFRAQQKGFEVPADMQQNALSYLRDIESHYPSWYSEQTRWTLSAYALYVRNLTGDRDAAKAERLLNDAGLDAGRLSMEAIGWLWPVIDDSSQLDAIRLYVNNHVVETAGAANFTTRYDDQTYLLLSSDRRTDAILLDALMEDNPQSDLIAKVVNGLLAHRTKGRWGNTQENVFVLLALDRYFNTYEAQTPDFVARLWLGDTYAGSNEFRGRTTDLYETLIPMNYVLSETSAGGGTQDLILSKDGPGRLYYRLGLQYAPTDLNLDPLDMGFVIQRRYEGVDDPEDVFQDKDGVWHIKAGARVRVTITMVADNRRYHVALVDPLPAGLEIINPSLAVSEAIPQDPTSPDYRYGWWWWGTWYEHQNMRDDRAEAFTSLLWDGVYEYTYIARATTPGTFIVPPAKAEEMYSPEVFGRSGSDWVIVK
ncbi:MAG TPA: Ig-like domain-containing protein [Anaerolineales bacterium]|nr:Ig-like domain-containing protein [Anaerolineales bacterium]